MKELVGVALLETSGGGVPSEGRDVSTWKKGQCRQCSTAKVEGNCQV